MSILCTDLLSHVISGGGQITVLVAGARHFCVLVSCLCHLHCMRRGSVLAERAVFMKGAPGLFGDYKKRPPNTSAGV